MVQWAKEIQFTNSVVNVSEERGGEGLLINYCFCSFVHCTIHPL
jgi:hypothetical protein